MNEPTDLDSALPAHPRQRDLLGHICFYLHFAVMLYILAGWLAPWHAALMLYLAFIPAVYLQWQFNQDTCVLNNTENWLRTGKWRNKDDNPEEGAWVLTLAKNLTGWSITSTQINLLIYAILVLVWVLALAHLYGRF